MANQTYTATEEPTKPQPHTPHHPADHEPSLGEKQPGAPFSLMFFTYPILVIVAVLALAFWFQVW